MKVNTKLWHDVRSQISFENIQQVFSKEKKRDILCFLFQHVNIFHRLNKKNNFTFGKQNFFISIFVHLKMFEIHFE